jgi:hypothetical protein
LYIFLGFFCTCILVWLCTKSTLLHGGPRLYSVHLSSPLSKESPRLPGRELGTYPTPGCPTYECATPHPNNSSTPKWATPHSRELCHTPNELRHTSNELLHTSLIYATPQAPKRNATSQICFIFVGMGSIIPLVR